MTTELDDAKAVNALRTFKAEMFQVLAHPTRIHIVESLRDGEMAAGALAQKIRIEPANLSQHVGLLKAKRLVQTRKQGNQVFYSLSDQFLITVLDTMRRYFVTHLDDVLTMRIGLDNDE